MAPPAEIGFDKIVMKNGIFLGAIFQIILKINSTKAKSSEILSLIFRKIHEKLNLKGKIVVKKAIN